MPFFPVPEKKKTATFNIYYFGEGTSPRAHQAGVCLLAPPASHTHTHIGPPRGSSILRPTASPPPHTHTLHTIAAAPSPIAELPPPPSWKGDQAVTHAPHIAARRRGSAGGRTFQKAAPSERTQKKPVEEKTPRNELRNLPGSRG